MFIYNFFMIFFKDQWYFPTLPTTNSWPQELSGENQRNAKFVDKHSTDYKYLNLVMMHEDLDVLSSSSLE